MALREVVELDIRGAQQQISLLESQLSQASQPINVPVTVQGEEAITQLQTQLAQADETVDVTVQTFGLESADQTFQQLNAEIDDTRQELQEAQARADALGDELQTTGQRGVGAFNSLRSAIGPLIATFAAGLGLREVVDQLGQAVTAASDLEQSIGGVEAIFGEAAGTVLAFGETADQAVGLSANAFNQLTAQLGAQLQSFGFAAADAGDEAIRLTQLGADLAATFGGPVNDAVAAIGSLLRGEINPIERYGVAVNQAAIQANALEEGLIGAGEELTIQTRALSALDLLFEQTTGAQGQFAREAETTAGQLERQRAAFENIRAELGEQLIPAVQAFLDISPQLIEAVGDLGPVFADAARSVADFLTALEPVASRIPQIVEGFGLLADIQGAARSGFFQLTETLGSLLSLRFDDFVDNLGETGEVIADIQDRTVRRAISIQFLESLREGADNAADLEAALRDLAGASVGVLDLQTVREFASASGLADDELQELLRSLIAQREELGLNTQSVEVFRLALLELLDVDISAAFDPSRRGRGAAEFAQDLELVEEGIDALAEGDLPVIIRDFRDLQLAAGEAGQSISDFLADLPDDITLDLTAAELQIAGLIEQLELLSETLSAVTGEGFQDVELPDLQFDESGAVTNLDEVIQALVDEAAADAQVEANLAEIIVSSDAVDLAQFIQTLEPEVAAALAEAFALDASAAADAQAALDGTMTGLADDAAAQLAETLAQATPQQVAELGVFAADNFVSNTIRAQIGESAAAIADALETALSGQTIQPDLILDLSNVQIINLPDIGAVVGGESSATGGTGGGGATQNVEVHINNATTEDVSTSATQAAQTIQAVSGSLSRVQ